VPTYQYACTACDERLEAVQKFTDDPLTVCDACGGQLRKVYSPVGIVFKGSGFYRTDSRNGNAPAGSKDKQANGSGDGSSGKSETPAADSGSSSDKSETKPAKKTEKASSGSGTGSKVA
jgi:putative FmdB family regulatory protein